MVLHALNTTPNSMCIFIWLVAVETYILADGIHSTQLQPNSRTFLPCTESRLGWTNSSQCAKGRNLGSVTLPASSPFYVKIDGNSPWSWFVRAKSAHATGVKAENEVLCVVATHASCYLSINRATNMSLGVLRVGHSDLELTIQCSFVPTGH